MTIRDQIETQINDHREELKSIMLSLLQRYGRKAFEAAINGVQHHMIAKDADEAIADVHAAFDARRKAE